MENQDTEKSQENASKEATESNLKEANETLEQIASERVLEKKKLILQLGGLCTLEDLQKLKDIAIEGPDNYLNNHYLQRPTYPNGELVCPGMEIGPIDGEEKDGIRPDRTVVTSYSVNNNNMLTVRYDAYYGDNVVSDEAMFYTPFELPYPMGPKERLEAVKERLMAFWQADTLKAEDLKNGVNEIIECQKEICENDTIVTRDILQTKEDEFGRGCIIADDKVGHTAHLFDVVCTPKNGVLYQIINFVNGRMWMAILDYEGSQEIVDIERTDNCVQCSIDIFKQECIVVMHPGKYVRMPSEDKEAE